jgi:hypothetical protein
MFYQQFVTPHPMFYPPSFGHPFRLHTIRLVHFPMPIYQQNQVQRKRIKDIKQENSDNAAKDGIYYLQKLSCLWSQQLRMWLVFNS